MFLVPGLLHLAVAVGVVEVALSIPFPVVRILGGPFLVVIRVVAEVVGVISPLFLLGASAALALALGCRTVGLCRNLGVGPEIPAAGFATFRHDALHNKKLVWNMRSHAQKTKTYPDAQ